MLSVICPNCGKESPEAASFCTACGTRLNAAPQQPAVEPPAPPATEIPAQPVTPVPTPPAAPAPMPTPAPVPPTPLRRTPIWWSVLRCIFSIPLTAVLAALLVAVILLFGIRTATSANTIEHMIKDIDISEAVASGMSEGDTESLAEALYEEYYEAAVNGNADVILTEDELEEFFEESTIDDFIAEKGGEYISALLTGDHSAKITKEELLDLVKDNEHIIEEITGGETLSDKDYEMIENFIDKENLTEQLDMKNMGLDDDFAEDLETIRSAYTLGFWLVIGAALFILLLLALFNLRGNFLTSLYSGIALLFAGGIGVLTLALRSFVLSAARSETEEAVMKIIEPVIDTVCRSFWIPGLVAAALGVGCIALFIVMRIVGKKKRV